MPENETSPTGNQTVAVALATHNGEQFIAEQLDSLARQTLAPGELVVYDDCSTDGTVEILSQFAHSAPFPVKVVRGTKHIGHAESFLAAARMCAMDLVAFCDQDDVWMPNKLARCAAEFRSHRNVMAVVHSALVVGDVPGPRADVYPSYRRRQVRTAKSVPVLAQIPGFAIVVRRSLLELWMPGVPLVAFGSAWDHDIWAVELAAAAGAIVFLPDRLVLYRQHHANVTGAPSAGVPGRAARAETYRGRESDVYRENAAWARTVEAELRALETSAGKRSDVDGGGFRTRVKLWRRLATVNDRRARLYGANHSRNGALRLLLANAARGDYGRTARGGLGAVSLGRDVLYVLGVLDVALRMTHRRSRSSP